ncbi:MAG: DUF547 domain-containing protein [Flavobacteriales bacterium]
MKKTILLLSLSGAVLIAASFKKAPEETEKISHTKWNDLLTKYVSADGKVNYKGFKTDKAKLEEYCDLLAKTSPKDDWSSLDRKVYWINAYNALTVQLIVKNYPTKSIKDIGGVGGPWKVKCFKIGEKSYDLDYIEHKILRKNFSDPRIHFGINCASYSCPRLSNKAFTTQNCESQLEALAKEFINDATKNKITATKCELSEIFNWFEGDFKKSGTLIEYLNKYSTVKINSDAKISHMKYSWKLNE